MSASDPAIVTRDREIHQLYRERPRSRFVRWSGLAALALVVAAWARPELRLGDFASDRRISNLERFLGELRPYPLQGRDFDFGTAATWAAEILRDRGWEALGVTLALSVAAIVLAAACGLLLTVTAARTLAVAEPYLPEPRPPSRFRVGLWRGLVAVTRAVLILIRSTPEYVLAFVFLAVLGPNAWPVVLALALHNAGILGKLTAEVIEDLDDEALRALRGLGASRGQILLAGIFPLVLPRFLLFFFYRWETCVREATVLGMLGIVSLGYWIVDARARNHYDVMFLFVLLGAALVVLGDLISAVAREWVRRVA